MKSYKKGGNKVRKYGGKKTRSKKGGNEIMYKSYKYLSNAMETRENFTKAKDIMKHMIDNISYDEALEVYKNYSKYNLTNNLSKIQIGGQEENVIIDPYTDLKKYFVVLFFYFLVISLIIWDYKERQETERRARQAWDAERRARAATIGNYVGDHDGTPIYNLDEYTREGRPVFTIF